MRRCRGRGPGRSRSPFNDRLAGGARRIRRARDGAVFGVLAGFARAFDLSVFWLRVIYVALTLATGVWPGLLAYILAALLLKPEPVKQPHSPAEEDFYEDYARRPDTAIQRAKRKFESIEKRIHRLEHVVTSRGYSFDERMGRKER